MMISFDFNKKKEIEKTNEELRLHKAYQNAYNMKDIDQEASILNKVSEEIEKEMNIQSKIFGLEFKNSSQNQINKKNKKTTLF